MQQHQATAKVTTQEPAQAPAKPVDKAASPDPSRRKFLAAARGAGALGALAALAGTGTAEAGVPAAAAAAPPAAGGYHETEHIRKYYSTARYW